MVAIKITWFITPLLVLYSVDAHKDGAFDDVIHLEERETGGQVRVTSRGRLTSLVDLDQEKSSIKVTTLGLGTCI